MHARLALTVASIVAVLGLLAAPARAVDGRSQSAARVTLSLGRNSGVVEKQLRARSGFRSRRWWRPPTGPLEWQWELDHPLRLDNRSDMGVSERTASGHVANPPTVYDLDGFDNPASTIAALHQRGDHVICYIEVGAAENYRPDYEEFPTSVLGRLVPRYPAERYLDINSPIVVRVIETRIAMCARKGFDAVEPDIDDSFSDTTGFSITMNEDVSYDVALANFAHRLGLGFGLKDGDEARFAAAMEPHVDFALDEQCFQYATCSAFYPQFARANKAVLEVEYVGAGGPSPTYFCPLADRYGFDSMLMHPALAGGREPCR